MERLGNGGIVIDYEQCAMTPAQLHEVARLVEELRIPERLFAHLHCGDAILQQLLDNRVQRLAVMQPSAIAYGID